MVCFFFFWLVFAFQPFSGSDSIEFVSVSGRQQDPLSDWSEKTDCERLEDLVATPVLCCDENRQT